MCRGEGCVEGGGRTPCRHAPHPAYKSMATMTLVRAAMTHAVTNM